MSNTLGRSIRVSSVNRGMKMINESGMHVLLMRSRKPQVKVFRKWLTSEVLPAIRKISGV